jgi:hypothetical protein
VAGQVTDAMVVPKPKIKKDESDSDDEDTGRG